MAGALPMQYELLLWAAAALVAVWVFLPAVFMMLGLSWVRQVVVGGPEALHPAGDDPQYEDLFDRLHELGFEPLGARVEKGYFCNQHWVHSYPPGRVFATAGRDCFATLYRVFSGQPWRLGFNTVFDDGSLVQTSNQMAGFRIEQEGYFRWGHPTTDLAELLRLHQGAAAEYGAARGIRPASPDLHEYCANSARHTQRYLRGKGPEMGMKGLTTPLVFIAMMTLAAGYYFRFSTWHVLAAFVVTGTAYRLLHPYSVRDTAKKMYSEDAQRGLANQWARQRREARQAPRA